MIYLRKSRPSWSHNFLENNKREPSVSALKRLSSYYNVSLGFLLTEQQNNFKYLGLEIVHAREMRNMSPADLACKMGKDVLRIGLLETGIEQPTEEEKQLLMKILNIPYDNFNSSYMKSIQTIREECYHLGLTADLVNYIIEFINSVLKS